MFTGLDRHLAVPAVLAGRAVGAVYADSAASPRSGLLLTDHRAYLAGDPGNGPFLAAVHSVLERRFVPAGWEVGAFTLYYDRPDWPAAVETALAGLRDFQERPQCHFLKDQRDEWSESERPRGRDPRRLPAQRLPTRRC